MLKWFHTVAWLFLFLCAVPFSVSAEYYQYTDENGNLCFTDNKAEIPEKQLKKIKAYPSVKSDKPENYSEAGRREQTQRMGAYNGNTWDNRFKTAKQELEKEHKRLSREYERLEKKRKQLRNLTSKKGNNEESQKAYKDKANILKDKFKQYRRDLAEYKAKIEEFGKNYK